MTYNKDGVSCIKDKIRKKIIPHTINSNHQNWINFQKNIKIGIPRREVFSTIDITDPDKIHKIDGKFSKRDSPKSEVIIYDSDRNKIDTFERYQITEEDMKINRAILKNEFDVLSIDSLKDEYQSNRISYNNCIDATNLDFELQCETCGELWSEDILSLLDKCKLSELNYIHDLLINNFPISSEQNIDFDFECCQCGNLWVQNLIDMLKQYNPIEIKFIIRYLKNKISVYI